MAKHFSLALVMSLIVFTIISVGVYAGWDAVSISSNYPNQLRPGDSGEVEITFTNRLSTRAVCIKTVTLHLPTYITSNEITKTNEVCICAQGDSSCINKYPNWGEGSATTTFDINVAENAPKTTYDFYATLTGKQQHCFIVCTWSSHQLTSNQWSLIVKGLSPSERQALTEAQNTLNEAYTKLSDVWSGLSSLNSKMNSATTSGVILTNDISTGYNSISSQYDNLKTSYDNAVGLLETESVANFQSAKSTGNQIISSANTLKTELSSLQAKVDDIVKKYNEAVNSIGAVNEKYEDLNNLLPLANALDLSSKYSTEINQVQSEMQSIENLLETGDYSIVVSKATTLEGSISSLKSNIDSDINSKLDNYISLLDTEYSGVKSIVQELSLSITITSDELNKAKTTSDNSIKLESTCKATKKLSAYVSSVNEYQDSVLSIKEGLATKLEAIDSMTSEAVKSINKYKLTKIDYQDCINELNSAAALLSDSFMIQTIQQKVDTANETCTKLKNDVEQQVSEKKAAQSKSIIGKIKAFFSGIGKAISSIFGGRKDIVKYKGLDFDIHSEGIYMSGTLNTFMNSCEGMDISIPSYSIEVSSTVTLPESTTISEPTVSPPKSSEGVVSGGKTQPSYQSPTQELTSFINKISGIDRIKNGAKIVFYFSPGCYDKGYLAEKEDGKITVELFSGGNNYDLAFFIDCDYYTEIKEKSDVCPLSSEYIEVIGNEDYCGLLCLKNRNYCALESCMGNIEGC